MRVDTSTNAHSGAGGGGGVRNEGKRPESFFFTRVVAYTGDETLRTEEVTCACNSASDPDDWALMGAGGSGLLYPLLRGLTRVGAEAEFDVAFVSELDARRVLVVFFCLDEALDVSRGVDDFLVAETGFNAGDGGKECALGKGAVCARTRSFESFNAYPWGRGGSTGTRL